MQSIILTSKGQIGIRSGTSMLTALAALLCTLAAIAFLIGFNLAMCDSPLVRAYAGYGERVTW